MSRLSLRAVAVLLSLVLALGAFPALAQDAMAQGAQQFKAGKYDEALKLFSSYTASHPSSADGFYYMAVCHQKLKNIPAALKYYDYVIKVFPGTTAAAYSLTASTSLNDQVAKDSKTAEATKASGGDIEGPEEDKVPLTRGPGGHLMVMARINGRPLEMIFDTGASTTTISLEDWKRLGNAAPSGPPTGRSLGVGGYSNDWTTTVTFELGKFKRRMPIDITENMKVCGLVGQTFFNKLQYNISGNNYIHIMRPNAKSASRLIPYNTIDIPFRRAGNELYVQCKINGVPMEVIFDTGAAPCVFSIRQLASSGISIPRDARAVGISGVGGGRLAFAFRVESLALGDVVKRNFEILASNSPLSVIGQTFFSDRHYVIDNEKCVIHFLH